MFVLFGHAPIYPKTRVLKKKLKTVVVPILYILQLTSGADIFDYRRMRQNM